LIIYALCPEPSLSEVELLLTTMNNLEKKYAKNTETNIKVLMKRQFVSKSEILQEIQKFINNKHLFGFQLEKNYKALKTIFISIILFENSYVGKAKINICRENKMTGNPL